MKRLGIGLVTLAALAALLVAAAATHAASRIAYADSSNEIDSDILSVLADGEGERTVAALNGEDTYPSWGPSRRRLVFVHDEQLWVVRADGKRAHRISRMKRAETPSWSPNGRKIAFSVRRKKRVAVFTIRPNGRGARRLTRWFPDPKHNIFGLHPDWSPNARYIVFDGSKGLVRMGSKGRNKRLIVRNASTANWSPNGKQLVFVRGDRIFLSRANGSNVHTLTGKVPICDDCERYDDDPAWSPSGSRIAYIQESFGETGEDGIHTVKPNGKGDQRITSHGDSLDW